MATAFAFFFSNDWFISAVLGLCCCRRAFSGFSKEGLLSSCSQAPHCSGSSYYREQILEHRSVVVVCGLCCPEACEIFLDQKWNPCPPRWQADSHHRTTRKTQQLPFLISFSTFCHFCCQNPGASWSSSNISSVPTPEVPVFFIYQDGLTDRDTLRAEQNWSLREPARIRLSWWCLVKEMHWVLS